ncbi:MAG: sensor domain-containing diguanylate cyclase [Sedimentibacter sp.]|uniref:sensor domain-containing diguanylate cyclase n=1 Tax=Sedimentibacter sp. TaxID=1960295 RepID=UPI00315927D4
MNLLSLISFFNAYSFVILAILILKLNNKEILNRLAALVNICFAIWSFTFVFFYNAPTAESAMFYHRAGSFGWILFCVFATHFFLILSEKLKKNHSVKLYLLMYTLPLILLMKSLFTSETPVAKNMIQSKIGWGWTYISNVRSAWFWLYVLYIIIYFCFSLYFTYAWARKDNRIRYLKQAKSIIFLDIVMLTIGFFTDLILPAITSFMPPMYSLFSILWGVGFYYIVKAFKLMSVYDAASPDLIMKTVMDPIILLDSKGLIQKCNQATEDLLKCSNEQIIGRPFSEFCESKKYNENELETLFNVKITRNVQINMVDSSGNIINALASVSVAESELDGIVGIVLNIHDITKYISLSNELERMANFDKLTDLPNRRLLFRELELFISSYQESGAKFAIGFIDLDGFKAVNDSYGHNIGDLLLVEISKMLAASMRKKDIVTRVGGDEFVVLISDLQQEYDLIAFIQRIRELFHNPFIINGCICHVGLSIGISQCPEDGITADELIRVADSRMYEEKSSKKCC